MDIKIDMDDFRKMVEGVDYISAPEIYRRMFDWFDHPLDECDLSDWDFENPDFFNDALRLDQACWILQHSPTMQAMIESHDNLVELEIACRDITAYGQYNSVSKAIELNRAQNVWQLLAVLPHELRHAIHDNMGFLNGLSGHSKMLNQRLYEADARAFQFTVCWELKEAEFCNAWQVLKSDPCRTEFAGIFEDIMDRDPDACKSGRAAHAVFTAFLKHGNAIRWYDRHGKFDVSEEGTSPKSAFKMVSAYSRNLSEMPYTVFEDGEYWHIPRTSYIPERRAREVSHALRYVI